MSEISKNAKAMYEMRQQGLTLEKIGNRYGVTRQAVHQTLRSYQRKVAGFRGKFFHVNEIVYQGIYDYFSDNIEESVSSFMAKLYGYDGGHTENFKRWLRGEQRSYFSVEEIQKMCEVVGKPFEETFKKRESK